MHTSEFIFSIKKRVNHLRELQDAAKCLEPLLAGNPTRINPQLPLDEQSELLPYDSRWEFPRNRLKLGTRHFQSFFF